MKRSLNIAVIGAGLAGLTAAIHLRKEGFRVMLFEKEEYPKHKVCGEYLSNEMLPYWKHLGINPFKWGAVAIDQLELSAVNGKSLNIKLPLGGFGISRFKLDHHLLEYALSLGCTLISQTVRDIYFAENTFFISTKEHQDFEADLVIGAFGKRSNIDFKLDRKFTASKNDWLAVKAHYAAEIPSDQVSLHNFKGGYCGISMVEDRKVNVCYLTRTEAFKPFKNIETFQQQVLCENPNLNDFFAHAQPLFDQPISISQIAFQPKLRVENHMLMCGDSAGLIHPLCGNGMAMAVISAKLASECICESARQDWSRTELEQRYDKLWKQTFTNRLRAGNLLQRALQNDTLTSTGIKVLKHLPKVTQKLIQTTHGKPLKI